MEQYIMSQPAGTFTNDELQAFVAAGYITQDDYNQKVINSQSNAN